MGASLLFLENIYLPTSRFVSLHQIKSMTTREQIIEIADQLIREKGYNAFSFSDISLAVGIKKASIHYYFNQKSDLGIAVIEKHIAQVNKLIARYKNKGPLKNLDVFINVYCEAKKEDKICIVGSVATDFNTVDEKMKVHLKLFTDIVIKWVEGFLQEGRTSGVFFFEGAARVKALMVITNLLAVVQLSRVTGMQDFKLVIKQIREDLLIL